MPTPPNFCAYGTEGIGATNTPPLLVRSRPQSMHPANAAHAAF
jgi:hypothetical protein